MIETEEALYHPFVPCVGPDCDILFWLSSCADACHHRWVGGAVCGLARALHGSIAEPVPSVDHPFRPVTITTWTAAGHETVEELDRCRDCEWPRAEHGEAG